MKSIPNRGSRAFTRIDLTVVIVVIAGALLLLSMIIPPQRACCRATRISCVNNLKQIGAAYRIWENDNGDRFPALQSVGRGGWSEFLTNPDQGSLCWTNYTIMANELGQDPKILVCSSEGRLAARDFTNFANTNISYFIGVSADDSQPQSLLAGDRNLGRGNEPGRNYGFSPENGPGNDVAVPIRTRDGQVCWSLKMHSVGNSVGAGNILLGDGSCQEVSTRSFRKNWLSNANPTTNWPTGHIPSSPSIRVLFP